MAIDERRRQKNLAKKAIARKAKIRQPRKQPQAGGYSAVRAAQCPVVDCLMPTSLFETGIGNLLLTRRLPNGDIAVAAFLVDTFCLGVKNAMYRVFSPPTFASYRHKLEQYGSLERVHPSCLRKLVEGAVLYAKGFGFSPHADYAEAANMFGDIDATACPIRYTYGKDGKPLYVSGPYETPAQSRKIIEALARTQGSDNFRYIRAFDNPDGDESSASQGQLETISYKISDEPIEDPAYKRIPQAIRDEIAELYDYDGITIRPQQALALLESLVKRYPNAPQLFNHLYIVYKLLKDDVNAQRVLKDTMERFPNYLFGRINLAEDCLLRGNIDRIPEIFDNKYDLKLLYPGRERFHTSEIIGFGYIMAMYFHAKGNKKRAEWYYKFLYEIDPNHRITKALKRKLFPPRIVEFLRRLIPWRL